MLSGFLYPKIDLKTRQLLSLPATAPFLPENPSACRPDLLLPLSLRRHAEISLGLHQAETAACFLPFLPVYKLRSNTADNGATEC